MNIEEAKDKINKYKVTKDLNKKAKEKAEEDKRVKKELDEKRKLEELKNTILSLYNESKEDIKNTLSIVNECVNNNIYPYDEDNILFFCGSDYYCESDNESKCDGKYRVFLKCNKSYGETGNISIYGNKSYIEKNCFCNNNEMLLINGEENSITIIDLNNNLVENFDINNISYYELETLKEMIKVFKNLKHEFYKWFNMLTNSNQTAYNNYMISKACYNNPVKTIKTDNIYQGYDRCPTCDGNINPWISYKRCPHCGQLLLN